MTEIATFRNSEHLNKKFDERQITKKEIRKCREQLSSFGISEKFQKKLLVMAMENSCRVSELIAVKHDISEAEQNINATISRKRGNSILSAVNDDSFGEQAA